MRVELMLLVWETVMEYQTLVVKLEMTMGGQIL